MKLLYHSLALYLSCAAPALAASSKDSKTDDKPCTITSPTSHSFFDLTALRIPDPKASSKTNPHETSWNATGYDLGYNFTVNICGPVIEPLSDVVGLDKDLWRNVSAYYKKGGRTYALGLEKSEFVMRGKKLVLNYTDGSPCDDSYSSGSAPWAEGFSTRAKLDDDDDHKPSGSSRRKSIVISMQCERDALAKEFDLKYVATMDECSYFFEGRTFAACPTANTSTGSGSLNPGGVFGVIALIAIIVYIVGGCVYNRAVLQQRGWQQVPNYNLWAGMFGFFRDLFIVMTSSCARFMPSRRGYSRVNGGMGGLGSRGRARGDSDAENRLIDELNEEWED